MTNSLRPYAPVSTKIEDDGVLSIGGCKVTDLAKEFGTPLYVMDEQTIVDYANKYLSNFSKLYPDYLPIYASKALSNVAIIKLIHSLGFGIDVVSGGELFTALKAGVNPSKIYFHGNNKSKEELEYALKSKIGRIVVDNTYELNLLNELSKQYKQTVEIMFRITPEIDAHTHDFIKTGHIDSKFGFYKKNLIEVAKSTLEMPYLKLIGIHSHIGSQIFDTAPFKEAANILMKYMHKIQEEAGIILKEINVGGGLGIYYTNEDDPQDITNFAPIITQTIKECAQKYNLPLPKLIIEPGRSMVANAGVTLYTIGSQKEIPGIRTYISIDGGMADNPRPAMYGAKYSADIGNKMSEKSSQLCTIAGKFCESGDILIKDIKLQNPKSGDILVVYTTGAYNYSMSSNYNRFLKPAMVLVKDGKAKLILKRESYEDLTRNDL